MSLFGKRNGSASCGCAPEAATGASAACCPEAQTGICCVKVLGAGCKSCHALYENTKAAVATMGLPIEVEYITDMQKIMDYGVMRMPALVVNENIVSMGRVLKPTEIEALLRTGH